MTCIDRNNVLLYAAPIIGGLLAALYYSQHLISHDASWYLVATAKFLDGEKLYVDVIEINPPLNFYLTVPPVFLANFFNGSPTVFYVVYYCVLSALSGLWIARILEGSKLARGEQSMLLAIALTGLFVLPISEFTQREHILLVFALPYFYLTTLGVERSKPGLEQFAIGFIATLGIALKPYFLILPAAILLVGPARFLLRRAFTLPNLGLALGLILYVLFVATFHFEYFSRILPMATKVYSAYGEPTANVLLRSDTAAILFFILLLLRTKFPSDPASWRMTALAAGALAVYLLQFKGWNYQALPIGFSVLLAAVWIAHQNGVFERRDIPSSTLIIAIIIFTLGAQIHRGVYEPRAKEFAQYVDGERPRILVYSSNVWATFPFVNAVEGQWASRFPAQWLIPGAIKGIHETNCADEIQTCREYFEILTYARNANTEDFLLRRPEFIFVDTRKYKSYFGGIPFDYIEFMKLDPRFAEAWSGCRRVGEVSSFGYDVWRCGTSETSERAP